MTDWICISNNCGHKVVADEKPNPMKWDDGHICRFVEHLPIEFDTDVEGSCGSIGVSQLAKKISNRGEDDGKKCPHPATFRYTWAGQPEKLCCVLHGNALAVIADVIAYQFQLIPISGIHQCQHPDDIPKKEESNNGEINICKESSEG